VLNVLAEIKCPVEPLIDQGVQSGAELSAQATIPSPTQSSKKSVSKAGLSSLSIRLSMAQVAASPDPLEMLRGSHPIVELLLAHRAILQHGLRLATRAEYNACCSLSAGLSISSVTVRLPAHQENTNG
jgi:hypothetical protein